MTKFFEKTLHHGMQLFSKGKYHNHKLFGKGSIGSRALGSVSHGLTDIGKGLGSTGRTLRSVDEAGGGMILDSAGPYGKLAHVGLTGTGAVSSALGSVFRGAGGLLKQREYTGKADNVIHNALEKGEKLKANVERVNYV